MTLYIHYSHPAKTLADDDSPKEKEWHVGDQRPSGIIDDSDVKIHTIYADGAELDYIQNHFTNLPTRVADTAKIYRSSDPRPEAPPCVWRGDLARFIFDNL